MATISDTIQAELDRLGVSSRAGVSGLDVVETDHEREGYVVLGDTETIQLQDAATLAVLRSIATPAEGADARETWESVWEALTDLESRGYGAPRAVGAE